jgi:hypothetical protein
MTAFLRPTRIVTVSEAIRHGSDAEPRMTSIRHLEYRMESNDSDIKEFASFASTSQTRYFNRY